jgi:hypothetical protein
MRLASIKMSPGYKLMLKERLEADYKVAPSGCWEWQKARTKFGHGKTSVKRKTFPAHRVYYQLINGFIEDNLVVHHLCNNPPCINPKHLEAITQRENNNLGLSLSAINSRKTLCKNGHPFSKANTGIYKGRRYCRICGRKMTNKRAKQRTLEYHAKGLNAKGHPLPDNWKRKYGLT